MPEQQIALSRAIYFSLKSLLVLHICAASRLDRNWKNGGKHSLAWYGGGYKPSSGSWRGSGIANGLCQGGTTSLGIFLRFVATFFVDGVFATLDFSTCGGR